MVAHDSGNRSRGCGANRGDGKGYGRKIVAILGPTAVGKSDVAIRLAKKFSGEIISADSRQVYKGLDIGTGKVTRREMQGVRHHLLSITDPKRQYSVARYVRDAREAVENIIARRKLPIICGGTGLYIDALLGEIKLSPVPPNRRLRAALAKKTARELFLMLQKLDAARTRHIDQYNPRRLVRAIEIARTNTVEIRCQHLMLTSDFNSLKIGLILPPKKLKEKIRERLDIRIKKGMIDEAKQLHKKGLSWKRMEELGLEYRYLSRFLRGKMAKEEMTKKLATEIWRYAKRQVTWFKRDAVIEWFDPTDERKIEKRMRRFLRTQ